MPHIHIFVDAYHQNELTQAQGLQGALVTMLHAQGINTECHIWHMDEDAYQDFKRSVDPREKNMIIGIGHLGLWLLERLRKDATLSVTAKWLWIGDQYIDTLADRLHLLDGIGLPLHEKPSIEAAIKQYTTTQETKERKEKDEEQRIPHVFFAMGVAHGATEENLRTQYNIFKDRMLPQRPFSSVILGHAASDRQWKIKDFTPASARRFAQYLVNDPASECFAILIQPNINSKSLDDFLSVLSENEKYYEVCKYHEVCNNGASYAILEFMRQWKEEHLYITLDSMPIMTAAFDTLRGTACSIIGVDIDSMSESHHAFADMAYEQGYMARLRLDDTGDHYILHKQIQKEIPAQSAMHVSETATATYARQILQMSLAKDWGISQSYTPSFNQQAASAAKPKRKSKCRQFCPIL